MPNSAPETQAGAVASPERCAGPRAEFCTSAARHPLRLAQFIVFLAWLGLGTAFATCVPADYGQELELKGFGTVYVGDLEYDRASDEARLFGGVCFTTAVSGTPAPVNPATNPAAESPLTLTAPTMRVEKLETDPTFVAESVVVRSGALTLFARQLSGDAEGLRMQRLSIMSPQFSGRAARASYTLAGGDTVLSGVNLRLGDFQVRSVAAALDADTLVLRDARATTCACENGGLYVLSAPSVHIDLTTGVVGIDDGRLETLGLRFALDPNLRLRSRVPAGPARPGRTVILPSPAAPEPVGTPIDQGTKLALPIQLFPGASVELGAAGFSKRNPVGLVSILNLGFKLGSGDLRAALGRVGPGVRADALLRIPVAPGVGFDISTTNRDWKDAAFSHEGALGVYAGRRLSGVAGVADSLVLGGQLFAALSQQTVAGNVVRSPRLGGRASARYTSDPTPAGTFGLQTETALSYYTSLPESPSQFGIRVTPSWRNGFGPLRATLNFDHQEVFGSSPFTTDVDRLVPSSVVGGSLTLSTLGGVVSARGRYAFELQNARNPVRLARLELVRPVALGSVTFRNRLTAEAAGLLGPTDAKVDAFLGAETRVDLRASELELGFKARYNLLPAQRGLELLEAYASYPFTVSVVTFRPFLALNAAPLFTDAPLEGVTGYGLAVAVKSCCGTFSASYRLHDKSVRTAFDIKLSPDPSYSSR